MAASVCQGMAVDFLHADHAMASPSGSFSPTESRDAIDDIWASSDDEFEDGGFHERLAELYRTHSPSRHRRLAAQQEFIAASVDAPCTPPAPQPPCLHTMFMVAPADSGHCCSQAAHGFLHGPVAGGVPPVACTQPVGLGSHVLHPDVSFMQDFPGMLASTTPMVLPPPQHVPKIPLQVSAELPCVPFSARDAPNASCQQLGRQGSGGSTRQPSPEGGSSSEDSYENASRSGRGLVGYADCTSSTLPTQDKQPATAKAGKGAVKVDWAIGVVTVMVRQVPRQYTQAMLLAELVRRGFKGIFDFMYLPLDIKKGKNVGYGFVNFTEPKYVDMFLREFDGCYLDEQMRVEEKPLRVHPASLQGYEANYHHFVKTKSGVKQDAHHGPLFLPGGSWAEFEGTDEEIALLEGAPLERMAAPQLSPLAQASVGDNCKRQSGRLAARGSQAMQPRTSTSTATRVCQFCPNAKITRDGFCRSCGSMQAGSRWTLAR